MPGAITPAPLVHQRSVADRAMRSSGPVALAGIALGVELGAVAGSLALVLAAAAAGALAATALRAVQQRHLAGRIALRALPAGVEAGEPRGRIDVPLLLGLALLLPVPPAGAALLGLTGARRALDAAGARRDERRLGARLYVPTAAARTGEVPVYVGEPL